MGYCGVCTYDGQDIVCWVYIGDDDRPDNQRIGITCQSCGRGWWRQAGEYRRVWRPANIIFPSVLQMGE